MAGELANTILIDTSLLIEHFRRTRKTETWLYRLSLSSQLRISAVTSFEFLAGLTGQGRNYAAELISGLEVLPFDRSCAETAAQIVRDPRPLNQQISPPDMFIAATALVHHLPLATLNRKHFERVAGLILLEP